MNISIWKAIMAVLFPLSCLTSVSIHAMYLAKDDPLIISYICISNAMNRLDFLRTINDTSPEILLANKCYMDLHEVPLTCSSTRWLVHY